MGALIMAHSDDQGLVLPPRLAPIQVVIVPIYKTPEDLAAISEKIAPIIADLKAANISVKYDDNDAQRSGWKFAEYELKGVPVRLGIGMRDLENGTIEVARRDLLTKESQPLEGIVLRIASSARRDSGEHLQTGARIPRGKHLPRRHLGRIQRPDRTRRLPHGPLGRHRRDRRGHQSRNQSHHPLHPARLHRRIRQMCLFRQRIVKACGVCEGVLELIGNVLMLKSV